MAPQIHTYHCICSSLLLASTHVLSTLPRRSSDSSNDLILPLPSTPPSPSEDEPASLPPSGYTLLLGLEPDKKTTIIRREDGFEKRVLYRCSRCRVVVAYEVALQNAGADVMEGVLDSKGKGREEDEIYKGKVIYLLPGGIQSTEVMMGKRGIGEEDVGMSKGAVVFE